MENLFLLGFIGAAVALIFAFIQRGIVMKHSEGNDKMVEIAQAIRDGANAYLKHQYMTVGKVFAVVFVILLIMAFATGGEMLSKFTPFAFITGGVFSMLAGFIGMKIATNSNARTAQAAYEGLNKGLRVAFSSGSVMGFTVVGLGMLDVTMWFCILHFAFGITDPVELGNIMVMNGMGASFMALFARVGGGIYTKAADVGADLVGKVEEGLPEDDPRNPATIADNVGDNVGDVAGMGADLFESYVGAIISAITLGAVAYPGGEGIMFVFELAFAGIIASLIGVFYARSSKSTNPQAALNHGTYVGGVIVIAAAYYLSTSIFGNTAAFVAIASGLVVGLLIGKITEIYTSADYASVKKIAEQSETGPATTIISGLAVGMYSTFLPMIFICVGVILAFFTMGGAKDAGMGLFGISLAAVGMLSTTGLTVAVDAYGPIADNAGGIAEMSELPPEVREITDTLDSVGNTTAAIGKGFAIGSAALTALALFSAYAHTVGLKAIDLLNPVTLIGLFIGATLPFVFGAMTMESVGKAAYQMIEEVRRQFHEIPGLLEGKAKADYQKCVDISTAAALHEMIMPGVIAIVAPLLVGFLFGTEALGGLIGGSLASGVLVAILMANAGGAWDNAKKFVEASGRKHTPVHDATVVGDTVGDPFKDTSGPAMNILIKLMTIVSLVFAPVLAANGGILLGLFK